jgi:ribosomal protein S18 acetylase RimI-like enzyme
MTTNHASGWRSRWLLNRLSKGLGRAILSENLRQMYLQGARQVFVETESYINPVLALYEAVGFQDFREILVYRKDYRVGQELREPSHEDFNISC